MDTVFDPGTAAERPYRSEGGRALGPGVTDMKAGLLSGLRAIAAIQGLEGAAAGAGTNLPFERLTFVANPDEEIGSPSSTPHIMEIARDVDACFVLECARANGDFVSARKGIADIRLRITGRAFDGEADYRSLDGEVVERHTARALGWNRNRSVPRSTVLRRQIDLDFDSGARLDGADPMAGRLR